MLINLVITSSPFIYRKYSVHHHNLALIYRPRHSKSISAFIEHRRDSKVACFNICVRIENHTVIFLKNCSKCRRFFAFVSFFPIFFTKPVFSFPFFLHLSTHCCCSKKSYRLRKYVEEKSELSKNFFILFLISAYKSCRLRIPQFFEPNAQVRLIIGRRIF